MAVRYAVVPLGLAIAAWVVAWAFARPPPPEPPVVLAYAGDDFLDGFVEMEAPIRPPTTEDGAVRIAVYLRLPDAPVEARPDLVFPPGTVARRVEWVAGTVGDVRTTVLGEHGARFEVLRPRRPSVVASIVALPNPPRLLGIAWPSDDTVAQREATRALGLLVEHRDVAAPQDVAARERSAAALRAKNDCAGCHAPRRPPRRNPGLVNRGTDGSGFFHIPTVLGDRAPIETYRPRNANASDRFVSYRCETGQASVDARAGVTCPDGRVPVAELDLTAALRAADPHARAVCASRRYLLEHMSEAARSVYQDAARACEGAS